MTSSPKDFPEQPTELDSDDRVELQTAMSLTPTQFMPPPAADSLVTPSSQAGSSSGSKSGSKIQRIKAPEPRRYMLALATDSGPRMLALKQDRLSIGRLDENQLCLQHSSISRRHAMLELTNRGLSIRDLGSQNGSSVNGAIVEGQVFLKPGDVIRLGYVAIFYFGFVRMEEPPQVEGVNHPLILVPVAPEPVIQAGS